jgi:large subunit ribosomal protein L36
VEFFIRRPLSDTCVRGAGKRNRDIAAVVGIFAFYFLRMKVQSSVKARCSLCRTVRRQGVVHIICVNPRHKARQGRKQRKHAAG